MSDDATFADWYLEGHVDDSSVLQRTPLRPLPFRIGRRLDAELALPFAPVSGRHAEIYVRDGFLTIRDLGSRNGTFVNDERVSDRYVGVRVGDTVRFGNASALFHSGPAVQDVRTAQSIALAELDARLAIEGERCVRFDRAVSLLVIEFAAALFITAFTLLFSIFVNAPLLELANFNETPNPSKAPWYFLGLQELLTMFHPMVAGVTIPGMGLFVLILAPYIDKNPSNKPEDRKFAVSLMTVHLMFWAVLVMIGSFFRGPGFNFVFPWEAGLFFEL